MFYVHMPELPRLKHRGFDRLRNLSPRKLKLKKVFTRKRLVIAAVVVAAFLVLTPIITYAYYAHDISNRDRLMNRNNTGLELLDRNGKPFYQYGKTSGDDDVPLSQISDNLEHAALASEDNNFYHHPGYSLKGIGAALFADLGSGDLTKYGGSTITQQLVKNKLLGSSKNFLRKYQEVAMAIAVERKYTKDEILDMYLNSVFFGEGAFGVKDAAKTYFGTTPDKLTVAQSSMLIGLLPAPSVYSPISGDAQLAKQRQHYVLDQMARHHYITKEQKTAALGTKLTYAHAAESTFIHAQHYAMMVIDKLNDKYGDERVVRSGFTVTTGLDLSMQTQAETIIKKRVAQFADQGGSNAGLVAIDPKSGEVRVLVGSVDWNNKKFGKYNMALALRQPGSSFKPIYYAEAFQKHLITPATIMHDRPTTFGDWTPVNYDGRYRGNIKVRDALATSLNIPAAEVMERVGVETAAQAAKRMGITTIHNPESYGLTLALGTAEVQPY
jgi:penicillin-binding protein 1A